MLYNEELCLLVNWGIENTKKTMSKMILSIWLAYEVPGVRRYYVWCRYTGTPPQEGRRSNGLHAFRVEDEGWSLCTPSWLPKAVVQERGSELYFSKKRQELDFGNSKLARFTKASLRRMGLNIEELWSSINECV